MYRKVHKYIINNKGIKETDYAVFNRLLFLDRWEFPTLLVDMLKENELVDYYGDLLIIIIKYLNIAI